MFLLIQFPIILKCIPYTTWLEFLEDPEQFLVRLSSIDQYLISVTEPFLCLYWIKLTLKLLKQLLLEVCPQWAELVVCDFYYHCPPVWLSIHSQRKCNLFSIIWHKLLLSSLHLLQHFGCILFPGQMVSLTLKATACWFMSSVRVILTFFDDLKTFLPLLAFPGNVLYQTQLNSASSSWSCLICCFWSSIIPKYCVSTLTFCKGGAMS